MNFYQIKELAWQMFCESTEGFAPHFQEWHKVGYTDRNKYTDKATQKLMALEKHASNRTKSR